MTSLEGLGYAELLRILLGSLHLESGSISHPMRKEQRCRTYFVGLLATLGRGTGALGATACSEGVRLDCGEEGKESQNWHEESGYVDEHC